MPVKYFFSQVLQNRELAQESSHKTLAIIDIIKRTHEEFKDNQRLYAIIVNVEEQELTPDFIVITEHGMGIMNLHHDSGTISREGDAWCANATPITSDTHLGCRNPHEQVQLYAGKIRDLLMEQHATPWLPGRYITWQDLIFDTAVCFTHPEVSIEYFRKYYYEDLRQGKFLKTWERFSIVELDEIPRWGSTLCFESDIEDILKVQSYRITANQIVRIAVELFGTTELTEVEKFIEAGKPNAYLLLKQNGELITYFTIDREKMTIGRGVSCDIIIPKEFKFVSRVHASIERSENDVFIEDRSLNGTFVNGARAEKPIHLHPGQQITLGADTLVDGVCLLEFSLELL